MRALGAADRQECGRKLNNRDDNAHLPFPGRERAVARFRRMKTLQKVSSVHAQAHNPSSQARHIVSREIYRQRRSAAFAERQSVMT
jgi:putative transposase